MEGDGQLTQEAKFFGSRPSALDWSDLQRQKEEEEAREKRNAGPADPRDSGFDMSLYQSPEYYNQMMELLPRDVRPFHLYNVVEAMKPAYALRGGAMVLDLCCGTGWACLSLAASHPGVFFVGVDNSEPMLQVAREQATRMGLSNVFFICANAELLVFEDLRIPATITRGRRHFDAVSALGSLCCPLVASGEQSCHGPLCVVP